MAAGLDTGIVTGTEAGIVRGADTGMDVALTPPTVDHVQATGRALVDVVKQQAEEIKVLKAQLDGANRQLVLAEEEKGAVKQLLVKTEVNLANQVAARKTLAKRVVAVLDALRTGVLDLAHVTAALMDGCSPETDETVSGEDIVEPVAENRPQMRKWRQGTSGFKTSPALEKLKARQEAMRKQRAAAAAAADADADADDGDGDGDSSDSYGSVVEHDDEPAAEVKTEARPQMRKWRQGTSGFKTSPALEKLKARQEAMRKQRAAAAAAAADADADADDGDGDGDSSDSYGSVVEHDDEPAAEVKAEARPQMRKWRQGTSGFKTSPALEKLKARQEAMRKQRAAAAAAAADADADADDGDGDGDSSDSYGSVVEHDDEPAVEVKAEARPQMRKWRQGTSGFKTSPALEKLKARQEAMRKQRAAAAAAADADADADDGDGDGDSSDSYGSVVEHDDGSESADSVVEHDDKPVGETRSWRAGFNTSPALERLTETRSAAAGRVHPAANAGGTDDAAKPVERPQMRKWRQGTTGFKTSPALGKLKARQEAMRKQRAAAAVAATTAAVADADASDDSDSCGSVVERSSEGSSSAGSMVDNGSPAPREILGLPAESPPNRRAGRPESLRDRRLRLRNTRRATSSDHTMDAAMRAAMLRAGRTMSASAAEERFEEQQSQSELEAAANAAHNEANSTTLYDSSSDGDDDVIVVNAATSGIARGHSWLDVERPRGEAIDFEHKPNARGLNVSFSSNLSHIFGETSSDDDDDVPDASATTAELLRQLVEARKENIDLARTVSELTLEVSRLTQSLTAASAAKASLAAGAGLIVAGVQTEPRIVDNVAVQTLPPDVAHVSVQTEVERDGGPVSAAGASNVKLDELSSQLHLAQAQNEELMRMLRSPSLSLSPMPRSPSAASPLTPVTARARSSFSRSPSLTGSSPVPLDSPARARARAAFERRLARTARYVHQQELRPLS
ncbi:uncharacterized protein AMSG_09429 [Thecamonas trahens ATCC 50062]|uniref:Uncharacterized protein n=1 Tax=Thecamonas trahens ATCC 50062 TaxID=461836 RepID=A0A0L0DLB4_THETB|nr:hypothetical protein AMSG_09429 [Thecamonas trahens ATCC 50062]KNC53124.1 hypothetical protein AMSG_09429 [Thecamonas trahens ATCC 50062]|eukprot:XP_013754791.1 hypothetical protein AMSG_09429 [Thecamonas trahens ATCC 50062]